MRSNSLLLFYTPMFIMLLKFKRKPEIFVKVIQRFWCVLNIGLTEEEQIRSMGLISYAIQLQTNFILYYEYESVSCHFYS